MKLLTLQETKEKKKREDHIKAVKIDRLKKEETEAVKRLNLALDNEKTEKKRIAEALEEGQPALKVKRDILVNEVEALEKRKDESLIPVGEKLKEAEKVLKTNIEGGKIILFKMEEANTLKEELVERIEGVKDSQQLVDEKKEELGKREKNTGEAEEEVANSTNKLSKMWVEYHDKIHQTNQEFEKRETEIEDNKQVIESVRKSNEAEKRRLVQEDLAIKDKYVALGKAKQHLKL